MAIPIYLAMTGAEFQSTAVIPEHIGWMACHFSLQGTGLSNLPPSLPPDSLLILDDQIPLCGHDPMRIAEQLQQVVEAMQCRSILLDLQRPDTEEALHLIRHLMDLLTCPVVVSDLYARELSCPVFLSPCPHHVPLSEHLNPWKGREIWLDLAADAEEILLTKERTQITPLPFGEFPNGGHADSLLHCHYSIEANPDSVRFSLWRNAEDQIKLVHEAEQLSVTTIIGLYSELKSYRKPGSPI